MHNRPIFPTKVASLVQREHSEDADALNQWIGANYKRLEGLAHCMLNGFPGVRRWDEASDVLHAALVRLLHAMHEVRPDSDQDFFRLAREEIRRELVDRARRYTGRAWRSTHSIARAPESKNFAAGTGEPVAVERVVDLEDWSAFQEAVEQLPTEDREVLSLRFYHRWTEANIGKLLHMTVRTVQHRWQSAVRQLRARLGFEVRDWSVPN
jgi:RNA polymerase sigma factor (sigma-70 family)